VLAEDQDICRLPRAEIADTSKKNLIWGCFENPPLYPDALGVQLRIVIRAKTQTL
jgi:hypothetical protein